MDSQEGPIVEDDPPDSPDPAAASPGVPRRRRRVLDLMIAVATCSLLFAAHRLLLDAMGGGPQRHTATVATGMMLILAAGHVVLTDLRRRHGWKGLDESRDFVLIMFLVFGLMASAISSLATPIAGALYLAATLVILTYGVRRP
jgi:hypothetical protein